METAVQGHFSVAEVLSTLALSYLSYCTLSSQILVKKKWHVSLISRIRLLLFWEIEKWRLFHAVLFWEKNAEIDRLYSGYIDRLYSANNQCKNIFTLCNPKTAMLINQRVMTAMGKNICELWRRGKLIKTVLHTKILFEFRRIGKLCKWSQINGLFLLCFLSCLNLHLFIYLNLRFSFQGHKQIL